MKNKFILFLNSLLILNISCSVGPDFSKPELDLPENFKADSVLKDSENNISGDEKIEWWESFNDPVLNKLIHNSTKTNLTILQAIERVEQARMISRQTFFGLFPIPTITSQYLKSKTAGVRSPGFAPDGFEFEIYSLGLEATWEIDLFGKIRRSLESDQSIAISTAYTLDDTIRLVRAQIATAYIQLRGAQAQRRITKKNIESQNQILDLLEQRFEAGEYSPFEIERARALNARTKASLSQIEALIASQIQRLYALSGEFSSSIIEELENEAPIPEYNGPNRILTPAELIRRRPDIKAAEMMLKSTNANIGVAVADLFPQVNVSGVITQEGLGPEDWFTGNSRAYSFGPRLNWSILNLGSIISNIDLQKSRDREQLLNYKEIVILALEEVENSINNIANELERNYYLNIAFKSNKKAENIAKLRYKEGILNYIDLLTTQQEVLETESEFIDSSTKKSLAYVQLYRTLAGSWSYEEEDS